MILCFPSYRIFCNGTSAIIYRINQLSKSYSLAELYFNARRVLDRNPEGRRFDCHVRPTFLSQTEKPQRSYEFIYLLTLRHIP